MQPMLHRGDNMVHLTDEGRRGTERTGAAETRHGRPRRRRRRRSRRRFGSNRPRSDSDAAGAHRNRRHDTSIDRGTERRRRAFPATKDRLATSRETRPRAVDAEALQATRAILAATADGIVTTDARGVIKTWNAAAQRLFGYGADEIAGKTLATLTRRPHD